MNGGVGTFASFGEKGPEIERLVMEDLGLNVSNICWQASRDRFAEFLGILAMIGSTCSKICTEIYSMQATEIDEVAEGFKVGRLGSSTMPHKRNPETCESVMSIAKIIRANSNVMLQVMETKDERDGSMWRTEWIIVPETCIYAGYVLRLTIGILERLDVHKDKMLKNLNILNGLILSEKVMFVISEKLGKQTAHSILYDTSMKAYEENRSLSDVIAEDPRTRELFTKEEIQELLDPEKYVGLSEQITEQVVQAWKCRKK
jgi:adenylosuccinate lyase